MKKVLSLCMVLFFSLSAFAAPTREMYSNAYKARFQTGEARQVTNEAMNAMVLWAVYQLQLKGYNSYASKMLDEWNHQYSHMLTNRAMTDHKPLLEWLAVKGYDIQAILGKDLFHALRLDDLFMTVNFAIPVVFLCEDNVSVGEYADHFVSDSVYGYRGLGQVVVYWGSLFSCVGGSWGTGFLWCAPIAMGAEWLSVNTWIPALNTPLWGLACHQ